MNRRAGLTSRVASPDAHAPVTALGLSFDLVSVATGPHEAVHEPHHLDARSAFPMSAGVAGVPAGQRALPRPSRDRRTALVCVLALALVLSLLPVVRDQRTRVAMPEAPTTSG